MKKSVLWTVIIILSVIVVLVDISWLTMLLVATISICISKLMKKKNYIAILVFPLAAFLLFQIYLTLHMELNRNIEEPSGYETIIVLGSNTFNQKPGKFLKTRLDRTVELAKEYKSMKIIVSGGVFKKNSKSQAEIMKDYLIEEGIEDERIYIEDKAFDTIENIKFSKEIIKANKLNDSIIISTNDFHLSRSAFIAKKEGMKYKLLSSHSPHFTFYNRFKEYFSYIKVFLNYGL